MKSSKHVLFILPFSFHTIYQWLYSKQIISSVLILVTVIAIILRLLLAYYNDEANDPHIPIIETIINERRIPTEEDGWEGFQPKLYHVTVGVIAGIIQVEEKPDLILLSQMVNVAAGIICLVYFHLFLRLLPVSPPTRSSVFFFTGFKPKAYRYYCTSHE